MSSYDPNQPHQPGQPGHPGQPGQQPPYGAQSSYGDQPTSPYGQQPAGGGYGAPSGYNPYGSPTGAPHNGKGFFGSLFDLSFTSFVTPKIIKVVYVLGLVAVAIATLVFALSGFGESAALGVVTLIVSPLVGLLYLCLLRMMCEFYLAITRMSEDINRRLPSA